MIKPDRFIKILGLSLFGYIIYSVGPKAIASAFLSIPLHVLAVVAALCVPKIAMKALRWRYLLKRFGIIISPHEAFLMYGSSMYAGFLTPGRLGDFSRLCFLKERDIKTSEGAFLTLLDRGYEATVVAPLACLGVLYFVPPPHRIAACSVIGTGLALFAWAAWRVYRHPDTTARFAAAYLPKKAGSIIQTFLRYFSRLTMRDYTMVFVYTVLSSCCYFSQVFVISGALTITAPFIAVVSAVSASVLTGVIPITYFGLGTRDFTLIGLLGIVGVQKNHAAALSLGILTMSFFTAIICLFCFIAKPVPMGTKRAEGT